MCYSSSSSKPAGCAQQRRASSSGPASGGAAAAKGRLCPSPQGEGILSCRATPTGYPLARLRLSALQMRVAVTVLNLPRRSDRRCWMETTLGPGSSSDEDGSTLPPSICSIRYLDAVDGVSLLASGVASGGIGSLPNAVLHHGTRFEMWLAQRWALSEDALAAVGTRWAALGLEAVDTCELETHYGRPVNAGEVGCFISHHQAWVDAAAAMSNPDIAPDAVLILEDDVCPFPFVPSPTVLCRRQWARLLAHTVAHIEALASVGWELLYLGRHRFGADGAVQSACTDAVRVVTAGFSSCAHAYCLSRRGVQRLLGLRLERALMPVDDLLPALFAAHPRGDVHEVAQQLLRGFELNPRSIFPLPYDRDEKIGAPLIALAFETDIVWQLESVRCDSERPLLDRGYAAANTEAGVKAASVTVHTLRRSDIADDVRHNTTQGKHRRRVSETCLDGQSRPRPSAWSGLAAELWYCIWAALGARRPSSSIDASQRSVHTACVCLARLRATCRRWREMLDAEAGWRAHLLRQAYRLHW